MDKRIAHTLAFIFNCTKKLIYKCAYAKTPAQVFLESEKTENHSLPRPKSLTKMNDKKQGLNYFEIT